MAELQVGKKAPAFTLESSSGKKVALKDLLGKTVVLYFYPKDNTPGCTIEAQDFRDRKAQFSRKKAVVFGISKDSIDSHCKFVDKQDLNFELLSDSEGVACEKYGVWQEKKNYGKTYMGIVRSTFVIDPEGKLQHVQYNVRVKDHAQKILESL
jgi:peroxiredoxin Q/BCP